MKHFQRPVLLTVALAATCLGSGCGPRDGVPPASPPVSAATNPAPAAATNAVAATAVDPALANLKGKWQRPDGDYIIEIRSVAPDGRLDAGYFNPRPINVSKAQATSVGKAARVFIELRDANYPGSTYTLIHDPATDSLNGIYFQATLRQELQVSFTRLKP